MMKTNMFPILVCAAIVAGCGKGQDASESSAAAPQAQQEGAADAGLAQVNVCERVPVEQVADAVGGAVLKPARRSDYGSLQGCEYEIDPSGADTYEYAAIWIGPPAYYAPLQAPHDAGGDEQAEIAERLEGLGDSAYLVRNAAEQQSTVFVLVKDRMYIEVKAEQYADARKMAELALSRL